MHNFSCAFPRRACHGPLARFSPAFVRLKNTDFSAGLTAGDFPRALACENIRFSSLFVAGDVPSDEERGETDVFAGYASLSQRHFGGKTQYSSSFYYGFWKEDELSIAFRRGLSLPPSSTKLTFRVEKRKKKMKLFGISNFLSSNLTVSIGYYEVAHETKRVGIRLPKQFHNEIRRYIDPVSWLLKCIHPKVGHHFYP